MLNSTDRMANEKTERDAAAKSARRAEEASIVAGLRAVIQPDEQLLGFARARISGGIKGRLNIGPEAFFAPFVNVGLTERRFIIQHLHGESGRPSEILPHFFALADLQSINFADIETYGGTPASRLVLHLANGQNFRLRLTGENNFASSKSLAEVFKSLTSVRKSASSPTQRVCNSCKHIMDRPSKFCPYCGVSQMDVETADSSQTLGTEPIAADNLPDIEKVTVLVTERPTDLLDDALAFLRSDPMHVTTPEPVGEPAATTSEATPVASSEVAPATADEPIAGVSTDETTADPVMDAPPATAFPDFSSPGAFQRSAYAPAPTVAPKPQQFAEPFAGVTASAETSAMAGNMHSSTEEATALESSPSLAQPEPGAATTESSAAAFEESIDHVSPPESAEHIPAEVSSEAGFQSSQVVPAEESTATFTSAPIETTASPVSSDVPPDFTYSEAGSSQSRAAAEEEAPKLPTDASSAAKPLRVHFHIKHPAVQFDEVIVGRDADEVVAKLKDRVVSELKFPIKLAAMRLTPLEFAQEIVSKYNQEERQALPRPNSCREFLHLVQAIGYATVETI